MKAAFEQFKASLSDPKQLCILLREVVFKFRLEVHIDLMCLPKGKEQPNHDYAILYKQTDKNQKDDEAPPREDFDAILGNLIASQRLPISIKYAAARKDGVIYNAVFLDLVEPPKKDEA